MDLLVRRRALLAAAKVALSFSIVACSAAVEDPSPQDDTTNDYLSKKKDSGAAAAHDCGTNAPPTLACGIPKTGFDAGTVSNDSLACCTTLVGGKKTDAGEGWMTLPEGAGKDPNVAGCCTAIIAHAYNWQEDAGVTVPYDLVYSCCQATGSTAMACTPWGPPAPPAITKLRREELVALMMADLLDEVA